ncbi:hypothetical protein DL764_007185 [Monosporascus ibericus]|uniref:Uncharacterized protein n=1 Tax=Monosporascus ibericus TaxID=155417 RepID=A0A4Q4T619_9PEZI|nr:hypothetical protein DL764_007185 [Monosporascus ibericus]
MPGSKIRRLMSHRRALSGFEPGNQSDSDEGAGYKDRYRRKDSWYIARRKKQPPEPFGIGRHHSVHEIFGPIPPLPTETRRSSASSLCDCAHNAHPGPQAVALRRSCLCALPSKNDPSEESLQVSSATTFEDDGLSHQHSPESGHTKSPSLVRCSEEVATPDSSSDLGETSSSQPEEKAGRSTEQLGPRVSLGEYSQTIRQLIQEADEAFRQVGSAIDEVKLVQYSHGDNTPRTNTFEEEASMTSSFTERPGPRTPDISPILKPPLRQKSQPRLVTPAPTAPARSSSKPKRKKSKKGTKLPKPVKSLRKPVITKPVIKTAPRWTLTENVAELFTGRLFNKIEVDEMLTEAQLEEYKRRRMSQLKAQQMNDASKSDTESIDTPIEPFHLDDLPLRIGSAGVKLTAETPVEDKAASRFFDDAEPRGFSVERDRDELFLAPSPSDSVRTEAEPAVSREAHPVPPKKSLKGLMAGRKQSPGLPSIPETPLISSSGDEPFLARQPGSMQDSVADSDYVYFQSSPCTVTAPAFKHGPIRFAKSDLIPEPSLGGADDGLDWTAFQMAILGGAGDWNSESDDTIRRRTTEEIEELVEWWESWGFGDVGGLVGEEPEASSPTSTVSADEFSDISYNDIQEDNPYSAHHRWQTLRQQAAAQGLGLPGPKPSSLDQYQAPSSRIYAGAGPVPPLAVADRQPRKWAHRESIASLPQSPMLDLRVIRSDNDDVDVVPMGYNLGHDLGDFLRWEAEHVYVGGHYSGSQGVM